MLSGVISLSAERAVKYYDRDNYYLESDGYWHGKLAESLKLPGRVEKKHFENLLRGKAPRSGGEIVPNAGDKNRCAGSDLTFSAPKSVSALCFKDGRIQVAFDAAVHKSLDYAEREFIQTRHKRNGIMSYDKTGNAAFAVFGHMTSRELDPQLHAHCVMPNLTLDGDERFMSIHNVIFENKILVGQYFRNTLAAEIQKLGYEIDIVADEKLKKGKSFEIRGVPPEIIEDFSKRRKQVEAKYKELRELRLKNAPKRLLKKWAEDRLGTKNPDRVEREINAIKNSDELVFKNWDDEKLEELATKDSRVLKKNVTKEEILESIDKTLKKHNAGELFDNLISQAKNRTTPPMLKTRHTPGTAIEAAINQITRTEVAFTREDVIRNAIELTLGRFPPEDITAEFDRWTGLGKIASLRTEIYPPKGKIRIYSTPELMGIEAENINICKTSKTDISVDREFADEFINRKHEELHSADGGGFTAGQKAALRQIVTTTCQFSAIQGDAGTGKSFAMLYAKELLESAGYSVRGLAPTGKAADELHDAAGIFDSSTIHKLIKKPEDFDLMPGKECIIVDESSMGGSREINKLLNIAKTYNAKVVFVGDKKQFAPVGAGKFFSDLQEKTDVDITRMTDVIRQKTPQTRNIVEAVSGKDIAAAFRCLNGYAATDFDKAQIGNYKIGQMLSFPRHSANVPGGGDALVTGVGETEITISYKSAGRDIEIKINPQETENFSVYEQKNNYKNCITAIENRDSRLQAVAEDYVNCYNAGTKALVITATNEDRRSLNGAIRQTLVGQGSIENIREFQLLEPHNVSNFNFADSFDVGQVVKGLPQLKIGKEYVSGEITGINKNENTLTIRNAANGEKFTIDPSIYSRKQFSVFRKSSTMLGINERIAFLKNTKITDKITEKDINIRNGQLATIIALDKNGNATFKTDNGKKFQFNITEKNQNMLTKAYALSAHKSQGMTVDKIIWHADTKKEVSTNSAYVAITRCKYDISVYTDDPETLQRKARKEQEKYSTIGDVEEKFDRHNTSEQISKQGPYKDESDELDPSGFWKLFEPEVPEPAQESELGRIAELVADISPECPPSPENSDIKKMQAQTPQSEYNEQEQKQREQEELLEREELVRLEQALIVVENAKNALNKAKYEYEAMTNKLRDEMITIKNCCQTIKDAKDKAEKKKSGVMKAPTAIWTYNAEQLLEIKQKTVDTEEQLAKLAANVSRINYEEILIQKTKLQADLDIVERHKPGTLEECQKLEQVARERAVQAEQERLRLERLRIAKENEKKAREQALERARQQATKKSSADNSFGII
jgi:conjugative relaxase-like TrwC/TraI family protein